MNELTNDELLKSWVVAMHGWFVTKDEKWETLRKNALDELMKRKLGMKMLEPKFAAGE